jgi:hypothetical protein
MPTVCWNTRPPNITRRVWRYQRGNQNPYIREETTHCPKEKVQKDKQRSTKQTNKTKDRVTWTPLKYVFNKKLEHVDDISFRELFGRIIMGFLFNKITSVPS